MADGSMIVSPISGLKNPADIGTKRLNDQRIEDESIDVFTWHV